ncbi:hypothetical protein AAZV13_06G084200 [Glycine max]
MLCRHIFHFLLLTYYLQVRYYGATSGGLNQQRTGVNLWTLEIILVKQGIVHLEVPVQK